MPVPSRRAYHVIYDKTLEDALQYASQSGWTGIVPDMGVPRFSPEKISRKDRENLHDLSESLGIEWGFHAPGDDISLFSTYAPIRSAILEYFKKIIDIARELSIGMTNMVVHPGKPPKFNKVNTKDDEFVNENIDVYESTFFENILDLIEYGYPDVNIVLENVNWTPLVRHSIPSLLARGMRLCLDIPKLYDRTMELRESDWRIYQQFSETIEVVHVHDFISTLGSHQIIGSGNIDFSESLELLSRMEHPPQYVFEIRPRESATQSLATLDGILADHGLTLL
jgi:sugar phosphate isomerase/epimerase